MSLLNKETVVTVQNRTNGSVGYTIPDMGNLHRTFQPREKKDITMEELRKLSYIPGGRYILKHCLVIVNKAEAVDELIGAVEPEYYYTEADVKKLLTSGSLAQLQDCLDFAPKGVIELVKDWAVKLEINDLSKREAIEKKTGLNITNAINFNKASEEDEKVETVQKKRRATPINETPAAAEEKPARRTELPKYNITSIKE